MPPTLKKTTQKKTRATASAKKSSPFKDVKEFEKELAEFANKFKTTVMNQAKRISDFFEMSCYNMIVRYYERAGYTVTVQNLQGNKYRYKCSTSGIQSNFSHFRAIVVKDGREYNFEIHHNLGCQSCHEEGVFTTPDISVIAANSVLYSEDYHDTKRKFSYVCTDNLYTFCEVKQFAPFPELMFSFIGIVHELMHPLLKHANVTFFETPHPAPSLMMSGKASKQCVAIKASLEKRYSVNILYDLFYSPIPSYSGTAPGALRILGKQIKKEEDLPF